MTLTSRSELSQLSNIFSGSDITDTNSLLQPTDGRFPLTSQDAEVSSNALHSEEESPLNPVKPSAHTSGSHELDNGGNSKKQTTNCFATSQENILVERCGESQQGQLKCPVKSSKIKYMLFFMAVANFAAGCVYSLPAPFFPREATKKGVSPTIIGMVFSCYQLVNFVACLLCGNFITHLGAKFTYVSGIMTAGICAILFGFLDKGPPGTSFIVMSFLVRSVEALGMAAFCTASLVIVSHEFPGHIGSVFATLETCVGVGLMVGPTIGAALYEIGGFGLPFWTIGAIICCSGLTILTCLPQPQDNKTPNQRSVFTLLRSSLVWVTCSSILMGSAGVTFLDPTLSGHLDKFGLSTLQVGMFFIIAPGLYAVSAPLWGFLCDRKDIQSPLLIIGNLTSAIGFLFIGPTPLLQFLPREVWVVTLGLVLFGLTIGCSYVPTMKCLVIGARDLGFPDDLSTFGMVSGLFNATYCLGAFFGPTIGGVLVEKIGFEYGSTIISGFYFFMMIVTCVYFGQRKFHKKTDLENNTENPSPVKPGRIIE